MLEQARRRRQFARAARAPVDVPPDLADRVGHLLRRRCLDRLGLAMRAGAAVGGHAKARGLLERGKAGVLLQAHDAADDGRERLRRLGRARRADLAVVGLFSAEELGSALGRGPTVHVAVVSGGHSERLLRECMRLAGFENDCELIEQRQDRAPERYDDEQ